MPVQTFGNTSDNLSLPNVRPTLDLNFAKTKVLDQRISFSRSSIGTYVGADGLIKTAGVNEPRFDHDPATGQSLGLLVEESRTNSVTYSNNFDNTSVWGYSSAYVIPNSTLSPDNTLSAYLYRENGSDGHRVQINYSAVNGTTYTFSCFFKNISRRYAFIGSQNFNSFGATFDLVLGTTVAGSGTTSTIVALNNGWYRCSITFTANTTVGSTAMFGSNNGNNGNNSSYVLDGNTDLYIWGAQIEIGSFPTSYIPTPATFTGRTGTATYYDANGTIQTAADGVARSNSYFPDSSGVMRPAGLLLEGASTNLLTYSEQFDNAAWNKANSSVTANTTTAPDGTSTADKLVENTANSAHAVWTGLLMSNGTTYTYSVFAKAAGRTWMYLASNQSWGNAYFNLSNGTIGTVTAGAIASIAALGNGWYRCSVSVSATSTGQVAIYAASGDGVPIYTGDGTSGIFIWGAQLEASPYPTSYIPTTNSTVTRSADVSSSSTVTRAADVASITGTNFSSWYRQDAGSFLASTYRAIDPGDGALFAVTRSDTGQLVQITQFSTKMRLNTAWVNNQDVNTNAVGIPNKVAFAWKNADLAVTCNGGAITSDTTAGLSSYTAVSMSIGYRSVYNDVRYNGTIARLAYWPTRLSNDQLKLLTQ